ncbi:EAL domain-containing protein [Pseudarthrobacter albicanus]|uniref:EAL domain-containing protein n=1 Tax=Pseudarthrobacter albicanus TaxID=2823873 RepID=UPI0027DC2243|nr:EAL domain-containing protein [Pseudarthrobacter albicanus]
MLADPAPEQGRVRDQLREHVAAHPGHPETALTEHLISLRSLTRLPAGTSKVRPQAAGSAIQPQTGTPAPSAAERASRIEAVLKGRMLLTAFQPIYELSTGSVVGVEAFTRFVSDGGDNAGYWFAEAAEARLGSELEFAALESALAAARHLPTHLYVALKLSPATCLDPLLPGLLEESTLAPDRMVLQLTDALTAEQPAALGAALAPLRQRGVRLAIDHAGSYFDSIRHIRQLQPDIIKLDRNLIAGIDTDTLRHAFGEAMVGVAEQLGAALIAEGIETNDELAAVAGLGVTAVQGYFLGRPTTRPQDWAHWNLPVPSKTGSDISPPIASIWF